MLNGVSYPLINNALQLFPSNLVSKAGVKPSYALRDEIIREVIYFEKWPTQTLSKTKPQSQSSRPVSSSMKLQDSAHSAKASSARKQPAAKSSHTPSYRGRGKKF